LAAIGPLLAGPDSPRLTLIHDPVQRVTLFLDAEARSVRRVPWPADVGVSGAGPVPGGPRPPSFDRSREIGATQGITVTPAIESLGTREIAGVRAEGTRSTYVIPAGRIGNERELSIVSERWSSPELGAVLETRYSDPRTGETRFRMTGIERREPDRSLFEVPEGFTVEESPTLPDLRRSRRPR
jgi:hypothetical protein